jgi:hypothetical protein
MDIYGGGKQVNLTDDLEDDNDDALLKPIDEDRKQSYIEERRKVLLKARKFRIRGNEPVIVGVMLIKCFEQVMLFSTVLTCLNHWIEWAAAGFMALGLRHIGIIIGNETYRYLLHKGGSRVALILGSSLLFNQSIFFYLVRCGIYQAGEDIYAAVMVPFFFAGIGTVWLEQGYLAYLGFDEMLIPMNVDGSCADIYFSNPLYKIRLHGE